MGKSTMSAAERAANKAQAAALLALVAPATRTEGKGAMAAASAIKAALAGFSLGRWNPLASNGKGAFEPSPRFTSVYDEAGIGYLSTRLPNLDNMDDDAALAEARRVYFDPQRGDVANKIKAAFRQSWLRSLARAGIETPRPKPVDGGNGKGQKRPTKTSTATEDKAPPVTLTAAEAEKFLPPALPEKGEPDRAAVVEYCRMQLANMLVRIEQHNNACAKRKSGNAMPPSIQSDVEDWRTQAKLWNF